ncbi:MAG: trypsin-like peptidase domain-containing protein, partial [Caulobacterales bacterium]|nr:trypsin-like peptidase domain-containing protein [Caulobacterales bacterium]
SGVIVGADGVIVTNNHVIDGATEFRVVLNDRREYEAELVLADERTDLAVLKIENGDDAFPVLEFGVSDALQVGDLVLAVGNPFGVGQTVTSGIVSAVARTNLGISDSGFFIQTDAAINPGNSGGALVDVDGRLVGVNTAIYSRSGGSIGIGFAIPSDMVRIVVAQALEGSTSVARAWIGVVTQDVTQDIAASLGLSRPQGALIGHVDSDSPAARAGLEVGDLILRAGENDIADSASFDYRLAVAGIGNAIGLSVWREGETFDVSLVPEAEPQLSEADLMLLGGRSPLTGAVVADLTAPLADRMRLQGAESGAVIVDVEPQSPAARMGFRVGDVVIKAQGEDVESAEGLAALVEGNSRLWRITFNRGGRISSIVIGG